MKQSARNEHQGYEISKMQKAKKQGIEVHVNGISYDAYEPKALALFLETWDYMIDYIPDQSGKIIGISYDIIGRQNQSHLYNENNIEMPSTCIT